MNLIFDSIAESNVKNLLFHMTLYNGGMWCLHDKISNYNGQK